MREPVIVAPRVGAWIETVGQRNLHVPDKSHPVWVRGLKPLYVILLFSCFGVAPRVGAWIETL